MAGFKELKKLTVDELKKKHTKNSDLINDMVGKLYPTILQDENYKIRLILARQKIFSGYK